MCITRLYDCPGVRSPSGLFRGHAARDITERWGEADMMTAEPDASMQVFGRPVWPHTLFKLIEADKMSLCRAVLSGSTLSTKHWCLWGCTAGVHHDVPFPEVCNMCR
jgi:hypothetical protein